MSQTIVKLKMRIKSLTYINLTLQTLIFRAFSGNIHAEKPEYFEFQILAKLVRNGFTRLENVPNYYQNYPKFSEIYHLILFLILILQI